MVELAFHMNNTDKLASKIKKQIDKELLKEYPKGIQNDNSGN
mgnify:CR=1 FL=1